MTTEMKKGNRMNITVRNKVSGKRGTLAGTAERESDGRLVFIVNFNGRKIACLADNCEFELPEGYMERIDIDALISTGETKVELTEAQAHNILYNLRQIQEHIPAEKKAHTWSIGSSIQLNMADSHHSPFTIHPSQDVLWFRKILKLYGEYSPMADSLEVSPWELMYKVLHERLLTRHTLWELVKNDFEKAA